MTWAKCQVVICKFTQRIGLWDGCGEGCKLQLPCKIDCTHSYTYSMSGTQFAHTELSHTQNFHIWSCTSLCVVCVCLCVCVCDVCNCSNNLWVKLLCLLFFLLSFQCRPRRFPGWRPTSTLIVQGSKRCLKVGWRCARSMMASTIFHYCCKSWSR